MKKKVSCRKIQWRNGIIITRKTLFRKIDEFHKQQALLPIEEKIKILVQLQKIAWELAPAGRRKKMFVWEIE